MKKLRWQFPALAACTFTPGEKNGAPVPVRVRGFKIRFLLQDGP